MHIFARNALTGFPRGCILLLLFAYPSARFKQKTSRFYIKSDLFRSAARRARRARRAHQQKKAPQKNCGASDYDASDCITVPPIAMPPITVVQIASRPGHTPAQ